MEHFIKPEWISETLGTPLYDPAGDSERNRHSVREMFLGMLLTDLNGDSDLGRFRADDASTAEEEARNKKACSAYRELLRSSVDEWLNSGFSEDQIELPFNRRLYRWLEKEQRFISATAYWRMQTWVDHHPRKVRVSSTGEMYRERPAAGEQNAESDGDLVEDATARTLLELMFYPDKWALSKCAQCGRYYLREKPRKTYKRQTYCRSCRGSATAMRRMKEKRQAESDELLRAASDAFIEWPKLKGTTRESKFKGDPRSYIASKIERFGKTRTWVSRNFAEIEMKVRELT